MFNSEIVAITSKSGGMDGSLHISDGNPNLLSANRNYDGGWLGVYYDNPDNVWNGDNRWVFVSRK